MNVLVTGGAGYIGHVCIRTLYAMDHNPYSVDNMSGENSVNRIGYVSYNADIADSEFIKFIIKRNKIEAIIHCAAFASVPEGEQSSALYYENNTGKTSLLVRSAFDSGVRRFVFASSCAVYGNSKGRLSPIMPRNPVGVYGHSKAQTEEQLEWIAGRTNMAVTIARIFNVAGTIGEHGETAKNRIIPMLVDSTITGKKVFVYGSSFDTIDGTAERDYIHVSDVTAALCSCIDNVGTKKINVCTGKTTTVKQLIGIVEDLSGEKVNVEFRDQRTGEAAVVCGVPYASKTIDIKRIIQSEIAWQRKSYA